MQTKHNDDRRNVQSTRITFPPQKQPLDVKIHFVALLSYLLLSFIVTWPMALVFTTQAVGEQYIDQTQNIWNLWWVKTALLDIHTNPLHTDLLFYPQGVDLYFHTVNLPSTIITLPILLLLGKVAAYNFSLLFALTMSGYAAFRLVCFLTGSKEGALLAGMIIGFNPLTNFLIRAQVNVLSLQWMLLCLEFFLRTFHSGQRRDAILTGVFFSLAVLTVGYFEVELLVFAIVFLVWALSTMPETGLLARLAKLARQMRPLVIWGGGMAVIILLPYLIGAIASLSQGHIILSSELDVGRTVIHSADLMGFIFPNRDHWLFGINAPWWTWLDSNPDKLHTYLGFVTIGLAAIGFTRAQSVAQVVLHRWLWGALAVVSLVLSLGPTLVVNTRTSFNGVSIPLPFALIQGIFPFSLVRAPERFVFLTYTSLGVLAAWGVAGMISRLGTIRQLGVLTVILLLILLEMPLHARATNSRDAPASILALAHDPTPGAVLELPLTNHGFEDAPRMLFQTEHGRPVTSGYVSRTVDDPYAQVCSPFQVFTSYPEITADDIVTPDISTQSWRSLLAQNGIRFITVYKQGIMDGSPDLQPLPLDRVDALRALANDLGTTIGDDDVATTYRLRPDNRPVSPFLQLRSGPDFGWNALEESAGHPFRWMNGTETDLCVFSPSSMQRSLAFSVTSYYKPRTLEVWVGETRIFDTTVPADGVMHRYSTPSITWAANPTRVRLVTPDGSASPDELGQSGDSRQLSLGFAIIALEQNGP